MRQEDVAESPAAHQASASLNLRVGGACAVVGAVIFATARLLHGDTPAGDAQAALTFVGSRPTYAAVHVVALFAALIALAGLIALRSSFTQPLPSMIGRVGLASSVVGVGRVR